MLEKIKDYNVGFGDCFILESSGRDKLKKTDEIIAHRMLVDYGSRPHKNQNNTSNANVANAVNADLAQAQSKYLMVTHFHADHYNWIQTLHSSIFFDEVYLPNFFLRDILTLQFTLLTLISSSHPAYQIAYNLLTLIPSLFNHFTRQTKIEFVQRGSSIQNNVDAFRVLWPDAQYFDRKAKQLYKDVVQYYGTDEDIKFIDKQVNDYFANLPDSKYDEEGKLVLNFLEYDLNIETRNKLRNTVKLVLERKKEPEKRLTQELSKKISSYQNNICICFDNGHLASLLESKRVLFLSDIETTYLPAILAGSGYLKLLPHYYAIKVPHHGTKDYFSPYLPSSEYLIIPNGYAQSNSWRITALYGWYYSDRKFICADYNACDYCLTNRKCNAYSTACCCGFTMCHIL